MSYDVTTAKWTCGCGAADHHSCLCAPQQATSVVYSTEVCYVIQREHIGYKGERSWVDSSANYYGENGRVAALAERDRMRAIFGQDGVQVVQRDTTVTQKVVEPLAPVGAKELAEALRSCIAALVKVDQANTTLTEGRGDLLYDNPDPLAREMLAAAGNAQHTYLKADRVLRRFDEEQS